jgi:hypothetical protein
VKDRLTMSSDAFRTITIAVPAETYEPFHQQAERADLSLEEAVVQAMRAMLADQTMTADARQALVAALDGVDTPTLWRLIQRGAETEDVLVLAALNEKRQRQGLNELEERVAQALIGQHDRAVLVRAKALALLRQRGEDVREVVVDR